MNLERAIQIAATAHAGQIDKARQPYILHPLSVMFAVEGEEARIVAVLHDVCEDCVGWNFDRLSAEGFSETVIEALTSVTKSEEDEDYQAFIARAAKNKIGRLVKIADLKDNLDIFRISHPTQADYSRLEKYRQAVSYLNSLE